MPNLKTTQFPPAGTLDGTEALGIVKGGNNVQTTVANLVQTILSRPTVSIPGTLNVGNGGTVVVAPLTNPLVINGTGTSITPPAGVISLGMDLAILSTGGAGVANFTYGKNANFTGRRANGTPTAPTNVINGNPLLTLTGGGWEGTTGFTPNQANIVFGVDEDWVGTGRGTNITFATTQNGTTLLRQVLRIDNLGRIGVAVPGGDGYIGNSKLQVFGGTLTDTLTVSSSVQITQTTKPLVIATNTANPNDWLNGTVLACIGADGNAPRITLAGYGASVNAPTFSGRRALGTQASPTALTNGTVIAAFNGAGYDGTAYAASVGVASFITAEDWSPTAHGTRWNLNTTNTGTTSGSTKMTIGNHVMIGTQTEVGTNNLQVVGGTSTDTLLVTNAGTINVTPVTNPLVINSNTGTPAVPSLDTLVELVGQDGHNARLEITSYGGISNVVGRRANGTQASPTGVLLNDSISALSGSAYDGTAFSPIIRHTNVAAAENWGSTAHGSYITWNCTQNGTINSVQRMRLSDTGILTVGSVTAVGTNILQVTGGTTTDTLTITTTSTPASATATGTAGQVVWDASFVYVCIATNTWKRAAISTW